MERILMVYDFDHTLVEENTDHYVKKLLPNGEVPEEIEELYNNSGWITYMGEIFKHLHMTGVTSAAILDCMSEIKLTAGMDELLQYTMSHGNFESIIISDSNSVFINHLLQYYNISQAFSQVFTNPAEFSETGCLLVGPHHFQDWCDLSTTNLCKGTVLKDFLEKRLKEGVSFSQVIFVGDGYNDLCPGLILRPEDYLLPRKDFKLQKTIAKMASKNKPVPRSKLKAGVVEWDTGLDILEFLKSITKS